MLLSWRRLLLPGLLLGRGRNRRGRALRNVRLWLENRNGLLALLVTAGAHVYYDGYIAGDVVEGIFAGITPLDASGDAELASVVGVGGDLNQLLLCRVHVISRVADSAAPLGESLAVHLPSGGNFQQEPHRHIGLIESVGNGQAQLRLVIYRDAGVAAVQVDARLARAAIDERSGARIRLGRLWGTAVGRGV